MFGRASKGVGVGDAAPAAVTGRVMETKTHHPGRYCRPHNGRLGLPGYTQTPPASRGPAGRRPCSADLQNAQHAGNQGGPAWVIGAPFTSGGQAERFAS